jgi:glycerol-3-phosphate dehydrogenase
LSALASAAGALGPSRRAEYTERLERETFDVLVVGGGVTGAGAALDAASRGLSVALVEKRDFGSGSSSRSSKLIHGGLRYLQHRDFGLVREALHERELLLTRLAPHLVRALPFLCPLRHRGWERAYVGAGIGLYDILGGRHPAVPRHRHLTRKAALAIAPSLAPSALTGAVSYHDACVDDARLVLALVRTAVAHGAVAVSGVRVEAFGPDEGGVRQVALRDTELDRSLGVRARVVVNAGGVWAGEIERLAGVARPLQLRVSKGVHILVPRDRIDSSMALILRTKLSVLFVIPWGAHWIVGTTDTDWSLDRDHPVASRRDIDYLLGQVNQVLGSPLGERDIVGVYAGLRPLVTGAGATTMQVSRAHVVRRALPGLVTVSGGKYTTYRVMAKDAVDAAALELGEPVDESRTSQVPLLGASGLATARARAGDHPAAGRLPPGAIDRLLERHGSIALVILDRVLERADFAAPVPGAERYLVAEIAHAVADEGATHVDDVLTRRTRISIDTTDRGRRAVEPVARLMAAELGWSEVTCRAEIAHYLARVDAELTAERMPTDARADSIRSRVRDPRLVA